MKYLLLLPLVLSWNFLFWGSVGIFRFLSSTIPRCCRPIPILFLMALMVALTIAAVSQPEYSETRPILLGLCLAGMIGFCQLLAALGMRPLRLVGIALLFSLLYFFAISLATDRSLIASWYLLWVIILLPASLLIDDLYRHSHSQSYSQKKALRQTQKQTPHKDTALINARGAFIVGLAIYYLMLVYSYFNSELLPALIGVQALNNLSASTQAFYLFFCFVYPFYLFTIGTNGEKSPVYQHLFVSSTAALILGFLCVQRTTNQNPSELLIFLVTSIAVPLLVFVCFRRLSPESELLSTDDQHPDVPLPASFKSNRVAVLIPAYNESSGIKPTVDSAINLVGHSNVFVVNDCSSDDTAAIVRDTGVTLLDLKENIGKARALQTAIEQLELCLRFKFLLILDADSEIHPDYLSHALPLFRDHNVAAVAGHAVPKWEKTRALKYSSFFVAYRIKLYLLTQAFLRYGQTTRHLNVSFIVPGFSSIYRTSVLPKIDIAAEGLVIEDFNMTFELHRKRLGRIAYNPNAIAYCDEPHSLKDYRSQVRRWHLGFWQTVIRHGLWRSRFVFALFFFIAESLLISTVLIFLPLILLLNIASLYLSLDTFSIFEPFITDNTTLLLIGIVLFFAIDYAGTIIVAAITGVPAMLWHGLFFFVLRWVDALYFLFTLPMAFFVKSNGRWKSPQRGKSNRKSDRKVPSTENPELI